MQDAKPGSHTIWDCKYHIVWITKYRFPVLGGDVGQRARELLREISRAHEMTIYAGAINRDHVHMLISIPPHLSVSQGGAVSQRQEFSQTAVGVSVASQTVLGSAPLGTGLLGCDERQRDGRGVEEIDRGSKPEVPDDNFKVV
jgi:putative transposase